MSSSGVTAIVAQNASMLGSHMPVAIDFTAALALRQMAVLHDDYPKYLLTPEVSALLHYVPDLHRKMLLATLKQREEKAERTPGSLTVSCLCQTITTSASWR